MKSIEDVIGKIVWVGTIGFIFAGAMVVSFIFVEPLGLSFIAPGGWKPALLVILIILGSYFWYVGTKAYHAKRGIDITLAFKEIPPE